MSDERIEAAEEHGTSRRRAIKLAAAAMAVAGFGAAGFFGAIADRGCGGDDDGPSGSGSAGGSGGSVGSGGSGR